MYYFFILIRMFVSFLLQCSFERQTCGKTAIAQFERKDTKKTADSELSTVKYLE